MKNTIMDNTERNDKIEDICQKYSISGYDINEDGTIDAYDGVDLSDRNLTELPLRFNKVIGDFVCVQNKLSTLYGCPIEVTGDFLCFENELTSLEYCPSIIGECFYCCENKLTSLEFGPSKVGGNYFCDIDFPNHSFDGITTNIDGCFSGINNDRDTILELFRMGLHMDQLANPESYDLAKLYRPWIISQILE